jgi:hypothetical protein
VPQISILWDLEDDSEGNYWHIVVEGHGITAEEVEEVLHGHWHEAVVSRISGNPVTFGATSLGNRIAVVFEVVDDDPLTLRPITAFFPTKPEG